IRDVGVGAARDEPGPQALRDGIEERTRTRRNARASRSAWRHPRHRTQQRHLHPPSPSSLRSEQRMTRVLIADDDDLMRAGLAELLAVDATIEVVGEASDGRRAVDLASTLAPDVVLMDVRMPVLDGIEATRELATAAPHVKVLVLTTFEQDDYVF